MTQTNPSRVTDRAYRYRANEVAASGELGPRICHFCGITGEPMLVGHIDGHEENTAPENLVWTCRSCNALTSTTVNKAGIGRKTHQYNPKKRAKGVSFGQYTTAVQVLRGESSDMSVDDAVEIVRATPAYRRSSYAKDVWKLRRERYGSSGRRNPGKGEFGRCVKAVSARGDVDDPRAVCAASFTRAYGSAYLRAKNATRKNPIQAAADAYERFHGRPADEEIIVDSTEHEHTTYMDVGELIELVIVPDGELKGVKLFGFDGARMSSNENWERPQLFIIGGDQAVQDLEAFGITQPVHEREILGRVANVVYYTTKDHLGRDGGEADYDHGFGEETGKKRKEFRIDYAPVAAYDTVNEVISFWGGKYTIEEEGIRD